jgi:hypothetical protein
MGFVEKLIGQIANANGGAACPNCQKKQRLPAGQAIITCSQCGFRGSRSEWALRSIEVEDAVPTVDPDIPPEGTKIVRRQVSERSIAWEVPPSGRSSGLLFFAILWLGFVTFWTFGALFATASSDEPGSLFFPLFSTPFWAVGIGMLYYALRAKFAKHLFLIDDREFIMVRSFFRRKSRKSLKRSTLKWVQKKEFYQQNYSPVYGIEIRGEDGKVRFGTTLTEEEKNWIAADMNRVLWPSEQHVSAATSSGGEPSSPSDQPLQSFEVTFPPVHSAGSVVGAVIGLVVVAVFIGIGIFALDDAGFFRWLWLGFSSLFGVGLVYGVFYTWRNRNRIIRVRGDRSEVRVTVLRGQETVTDTHLPRQGQLSVRSFKTGQSNNQDRLRIELLGQDEVVPIAKWYPTDQAAEPLAELKRALGN